MAAEQSGNEKYRLGVEKRRQIFGDDAAPGGAGTRGLAPYLSEWVLENVFGDLWCRPALGDKTRVLITVVALAATGQWPHLRGHLANALRLGWTREELVEILVHLGPYVGVPTVHSALDILQEVLAAEEGKHSTS